jgi:hypothetical protein
MSTGDHLENMIIANGTVTSTVLYMFRMVIHVSSLRMLQHYNLQKIIRILKVKLHIDQVRNTVEDVKFTSIKWRSARCLDHDVYPKI